MTPSGCPVHLRGHGALDGQAPPGELEYATIPWLASDERCHVLRDMKNYPENIRFVLPTELIKAILAYAVEITKPGPRAFRITRRRSRTGATLRPGRETPLWNELRAQLRPRLLKYGQQVNLGRMLGLPRQRINAFVTGGGEMPDAERTLQLLAWLMATNQGKRPT